MQPSESEIRKEVEALRDIRRRSSNPLTIDPDLPNPLPGSPQVSNTYWKQAKSSSPVDGDSTSSHEDSSGSSNAEHDTTAGEQPNNPADDPFRLFWLPASLHPEIAPAEFRAFLNEHARTPPPEDDSPIASRSNSTASVMPPSLSSSSSLGRKRSMLSRQYKPSIGDGVENADETVVKRNRSSIYSVNRNTGPQLTINDLQKLERLAEEASESDDPSRLRSILRRSLSLNVSPSADDFSDLGDEADIPVIVPPPGQILRRAARTKIRKPGLPGDGGGHRFGASRRGARSETGHSPMSTDTRDDVSSSDHGDSVESATPSRSRTFSLEDPPATRPDSFSEEASIYDAYARGDDDYDENDMSNGPVLVVPPDLHAHEIELPLSPAIDTPPASLLEALGPVLHQPQPQRLLAPTPIDLPQRAPSRTPSPDTSYDATSPSPSHSPPAHRHESPTHSQQDQHHQHRKEKDKKGLFGKWGGDKGGKKGHKEKHNEREKEIRERAEKEKESGFFGSLFGSKKKQDETPSISSSHGREAAQALLGASKAYVPSPSPVGSMANNSGNLSPYARYPIHVERAIYRLSHIKLSNPRRPLYEQVLISNLMFWYLGVINKPSTPDSPPGEDKPIQMTEKQAKEKEQKERDELRQRAERERIDREQKEREQREKEADSAAMSKKREQSPSGRRGALTKPAGGGAGRRAEQPVKGTQYDQQHRVIEQEYVGFNGQSSTNHASPPMIRTGSAPPQAYNRAGSVPKMQPQSQPSDNYYYNGDIQQQQQPQSSYNHLPPGAMAPVATNEQPWRTQSPQQVPPRNHSSPSPPPILAPNSHRRSRSPPHNSAPVRYNESVTGRPSRALSASAAPPTPTIPAVNGQLRKGRSANAVVAHGPASPSGGEEDVPLAVWQQQRRK